MDANAFIEGICFEYFKGIALKNNKKLKKFFPLDFHGQCRSWRFVIRANNTTEVFDALMWRSYISLRRKDVNLLNIAIETYPYESEQSKGAIAKFFGDYGCMMHLKILGPIVEVSALNRAYLEKNGV